MKIFSYTALHYGIDYLPYALRSINDVVDQSFIVYSPHPSQSHQPNIERLESPAELYGSIEHIPKVTWTETHNSNHEHEHRNLAVRLCENDGADLIVVQDYDEIWHADMLQEVLRYIWDENKARNWLINFTHLWRSFNWCCKDDLWPVRIIDTRHSDGIGYVPRELGDIFHFGYAITDKSMAYKWEIQGHKNELRPNWFAEKWTWPPIGDCHPTNENDWWTPEEFNRYKLPELMGEHKWWDVEYIK